MSLRLSSTVPFPISLLKLSLSDFTPGWALTSSSSDGLEAAPHVMAPGDIYAAMFTLCTPVAVGLSSIGSLHFRCKRLPEGSRSRLPSEAGSAEGGSEEGGVAGRAPAAVREIMFADREIVHPLPRICVCSRMVEVYFQAPAQVALGAVTTVVLKLENCVEEHLAVRVGVTPGPSGEIVGDTVTDVWLKGGEASEVILEVRALEAGVLDLVGNVEVLLGRASADLDAAGPVSAEPDQGLEFALGTSVFVTV